MAIIPSRYRKLLLWVLGIVCILVVVCVAQLQTRQNAKTRELMEVFEITNFLNSYAFLNNGNLPESWDKLVEEGLGNFSGDSFVVGKEYSATAYSELKNVNKYKIAFGMRPEFITIEGKTVKDSEGKPILLIAPAGKTRIDESAYRHASLRLARVMLDPYKEGIDAEEKVDD